MKAIFSAVQLGHAPSRYLSNGHIVAYPDSPARARALLEGAREAGAQICAARRYDPAVFSEVHAQHYVNFLQSAHGEWKQIEGAAPELMPSLRPMAPILVEPEHVMARAGRYMMDFSCAITEKTWASVSASAMTALTAADLCLKGDNVVYALCRPPGHHAFVGRAGGFCYLNNTALAAQRLRSVHERVAILDIDVHHGNGTQAIFWDDPLTLYLSTHQMPLYPGTGAAAERGSHDNVVNVPCAAGTGSALWREKVEGTILQRLDAFRPELLMISAGFDAHEADPLAQMRLTEADFAWVTGKLVEVAERHSQGRIVSVLEGGYDPDALARSVLAHLEGLAGTTA